MTSVLLLLFFFFFFLLYHGEWGNYFIFGKKAMKLSLHSPTLRTSVALRLILIGSFVPKFSSTLLTFTLWNFGLFVVRKNNVSMLIASLSTPHSTLIPTIVHSNSLPSLELP